MKSRFHGDLNDFLPPERRYREIIQPLGRRASVKDVIEALGVPHTEVGSILVNGNPVDFACIVSERDSIEVYPGLGYGDDSQKVCLRPPISGDHRFVLDTHLGKLAGYLRMLGFDTLYDNTYDDDTLAGIASTEDRILLTRDKGLLKRSIVTYGYYVRRTDPLKQVAEVLGRYDLERDVQPFRRCMRCNGLTEPVSKEDVYDQLEPKTRIYYDEFRHCRSCGRVYWKGSHYERMLRLIESFAGDT